MPKEIVEGDRVYNITTDLTGIVKTIYPEINIAIVDYQNIIFKERLDDLIKLEDPVNDTDDQKRRSLLGKARGLFK